MKHFNRRSVCVVLSLILISSTSMLTVGAIVGGIAGGGKGAAIGLIIGGAGGAGSLAVKDSKELKIESGTEMLMHVTR